jgi:type VI secretion system VasD/TssJ family lipoprotein
VLPTPNGGCCTFERYEYSGALTTPCSERTAAEPKMNMVIASPRTALVLLSLFAACASTPPPAPEAPPAQQCAAFEIVDVELAPDPRLNPDREGYSRSVVVRLYQLEGAEPFLQASYEDVWHDPQGGSAARTVVGGPEELILIPGRMEKRALKRNPKATHVGVAAKFREYQGATGWKAVAALSPANPCPSELDPLAGKVGLELANFSVRLR